MEDKNCLDFCVKCDVCGEWVHESEVAFYGDNECDTLTAICHSCCNKGWCACDRCGRIERNGEWHDVRDKYNDDLSVCTFCADEIKKHGY